MEKSPDRSRDLLQFERGTSALEERLRVVPPSSDAKPRMPTTSVPESSVLGRLKAFLPMMDEANRALFSGIEEKGREQYDIEVVDEDDEKPHIEMDLALGIADLKTPEALAAAERAAAGQGNNAHQVADDSDDDSSDDDDDAQRRKPRKVEVIEKS